MSTTHVAVKALPPSLRSALESVGYGRADIGVSPAERYTMANGGDAGCRAFTMCVDLATGRREIAWGSWGGANMFNPSNHVDLDTTPRAIPEGCAIISGQEGGGRPVWASIRVNPSSLAPLLPAVASVSDKERAILRTVRGYKGGDYRRTELARIGATDADMRALADRGLLKINRAGAVSITTEGRNAAGGF